MTISNEKVLTLARKNGIDLKEETMKGNESGVDFYVVIATDREGKEWVLRIPRRPDVIPSTIKEKTILDVVRPHLPVQVPNWLVYNEEIIAYPLLDGVPTGIANPEIQNYNFAIDHENLSRVFNETLAQALVALHQTNLERVKAAGLDVETPEDLRITMSNRITKAKEAYGISEELQNRWQNWLEDESYWPKKAGFIHGDLHAGHILINKAGEVTGIIDWTEGRVTDMSRDFMAQYMVFGEKALDDLIAAYANAGGYTWPRMKEHILELVGTAPLDIVDFAIKSDMEEYHQMAREALGVAEGK